MVMDLSSARRPSGDGESAWIDTFGKDLIDQDLVAVQLRHLDRERLRHGGGDSGPDLHGASSP
jgi:hypothetical protein